MVSGAVRLAKEDHRAFNRQGQAFDRGETFSGVDYDTGLKAVEKLRQLLPKGISLTQFALKWILMSPAVTCAIPGAKRPSQVDENAAAADLPPIPKQAMDQVREIYQTDIKPLVHQYW